MTYSDESLRQAAQKKADRARSWDAACCFVMAWIPLALLVAFFGIAWYRYWGP